MTSALHTLMKLPKGKLDQLKNLNKTTIKPLHSFKESVYHKPSRHVVFICTTTIGPGLFLRILQYIGGYVIQPHPQLSKAHPNP